MVNLNGHEAGNGGYSQGTPTARRAFLYSEGNGATAGTIGAAVRMSVCVTSFPMRHHQAITRGRASSILCSFGTRRLPRGAARALLEKRSRPSHPPIFKCARPDERNCRIAYACGIDRQNQTTRIAKYRMTMPKLTTNVVRPLLSPAYSRFQRYAQEPISITASIVMMATITLT
jgi:hypothetical protein